ncbi:MAG: hypothetical protein ACYDDA_05265 [Acidiferrobacteraceae bacterium]
MQSEAESVLAFPARRAYASADMSWDVPDPPERVAEQMARAVYRDGVWYRRENGKLVVWPVLKLDRFAAQELRQQRIA